jgi:N6-L-threonylcarbamoyladenine synthase
LLLAIESSCDESAAALYDGTSYMQGACSLKESLLTHVISSQSVLHSQYGGVVPELASREHMKNVPLVIDEVLSSPIVRRLVAEGRDTSIKAIAVTQGPGLKGCLLVGVSIAKGLAMRLSVPLLPVNHLEGHILSTFLSEGIDDEERVFPAIMVLVSGGHTQLILCTGVGKYTVLATTMDDAAGEAFDKVGTLLGLPYPAGAEVSRMAEKGDPERFKLPIGVPQHASQFSFSGLKTAAARLIASEEAALEHDPMIRSHIAKALEEAIINALCHKLIHAIESLRKEKGIKLQSLLLAGGVAANKPLRARLSSIAEDYTLRCIIPAPEFCTDNAAMIGAVAAMKLKRNPSLLLPEGKEGRGVYDYSFGAKPRFPLSGEL